jgi:hypothetical protein
LEPVTVLYRNLFIVRVFSMNAAILFQYHRGGRKAIPDPEGDELAGDKEARKHAAMVARDMLSGRIWYKRGLEHWAFVVTNEAGRQVAIVPFSNPYCFPRGPSFVFIGTRKVTQASRDRGVDAVMFDPDPL